jgi:hypothetical protein
MNLPRLRPGLHITLPSLPPPIYPSNPNNTWYIFFFKEKEKTKGNLTILNIVNSFHQPIGLGFKI